MTNGSLRTPLSPSRPGSTGRLGTGRLGSGRLGRRAAVCPPCPGFPEAPASGASPRACRPRCRPGPLAGSGVRGSARPAPSEAPVRSSGSRRACRSVPFRCSEGRRGIQTAPPSCRVPIPYSPDRRSTCLAFTGGTGARPPVPGAGGIGDFIPTPTPGTSDRDGAPATGGTSATPGAPVRGAHQPAGVSAVGTPRGSNRPSAVTSGAGRQVARFRRNSASPQGSGTGIRNSPTGATTRRSALTAPHRPPC